MVTEAKAELNPGTLSQMLPLAPRKVSLGVLLLSLQAALPKSWQHRLGPRSILQSREWEAEKGKEVGSPSHSFGVLGDTAVP